MENLIKEYQQTADDIQSKIFKLKAELPHTRGEKYIQNCKRLTQLHEMYEDTCYTIKKDSPLHR